MKVSKLVVSLLAALSVSAWAQNLAIVNGKPVPSSRVEALKQQVERSGRPVTPEILAQIKEELILIDCVLLEQPKSLNCLDLWITSWFYNQDNLNFLK